MKLAGGSGKGLRLLHGSGTRERPRWPSFSCRELSCACCSVLGNGLSREGGVPPAHGHLLSLVERTERYQSHGEWLRERKETNDATASDHDP